MFCQTYNCKNKTNFPKKTGMFREKQGEDDWNVSLFARAKNMAPSVSL